MFEVAIPDTSLINCTGLRGKTQKIGLMARAFAIFRVERVIIYTTGRLSVNHQRDPDIMLRLLRYMDTPQYLRKRAFSRSPTMQFVGTLPPLRTRSHPLAISIDNLQLGDVRWGIQVRPGKVDLGLDKLIDYDFSVDSRSPTLFRVVAISPKVHIEKIDRSSVGSYFGYEVELIDDLVRYLQRSAVRPRIAFTKKGVPFKTMQESIIALVQSTKGFIALFGGPHYGVSEILTNESALLKEEIDLWINSVSGQGTETVRLEEAILVSLGLLNNIIGNIVAKPGYY